MGIFTSRASGRIAAFGALAILASAFLLPPCALAVPVFANGQGGANCALCHTVVPQLNGYGRYVLMTNFSRGLNRHLQMMQGRSLPVALEATVNASRPTPAGLPALSSSLVQWLSAGFLGKDVSYFATVPVVSGGFPAASVDQLWVADNALDRGHGSLQIGRFPTPIFAPWISQPLSLSGYGIASMQIGSNAATLADNRWGASYTQVGANGLIGNVAYLAGNGPLENAFATETEGNAWSASLQFLSPEKHWSGGIATLFGSIFNAGGAIDRYTREAGLLSYDIGRFNLLAIGTLGHDTQPLPLSLASSSSKAYAFETIYAPLTWIHLDTRYERTNDGLGNATTNYIFDLALNLRPNVVLTVEDLARAGGTPITQYQLLWAGPWFRNRMPPGTMQPPPDIHGLSAARARAIENGRSIFYTGKDLNGVRIHGPDPLRVYQSCAVCHQPSGVGGVRLPDGAISAELGPHAHMLDNMGVSSAANAKRWSLTDFERAISHGVDNTGMALSPVMPRWQMSKRDLHDIALYVLTQLDPHG
ncbi:MAG: hypothetical protein ACP5O6_05120 [Candidatus Baltobacteraceae bacterium]